MRGLRKVVSSLRTAMRKSLCRNVPKPIYFAVLGASGCLFGALVGEGLLVLTRSTVAPEQLPRACSVCMVIDSSSSMEGDKLAEAKEAANRFAGRQDPSRTAVGLIEFADRATVRAPVDAALSTIAQAIEDMMASGYTAMDSGLWAAAEALKDAPGTRHVLLFTDGFPDSLSHALVAARDLQHQGIQIVAIGTGDADREYLTDLTGDPRLVFWASSGRFERAFDAAERMITGASLVDSSVGHDLLAGAVRVGGWTAPLSLALGLALIAGQNRYLRRPLLSGRDLLSGGVRSLAAGFVAGALGQILFCLVRADGVAGVLLSMAFGAALGFGMAFFLTKLAPGRALSIAGLGATMGLVVALEFRWLLSTPSAFHHAASVPIWTLIGALLGWTSGRTGSVGSPRRLAYVGGVCGCIGVGVVLIVEGIVGQTTGIVADGSTRPLGWCVLGAALGRGLALFIPNLGSRRAAVGGGVGGLAGGIVFLVATTWLDGIVGRLIGAAVLGLAIGLMIALVELACREVWLDVDYGHGEKRIVNLGQDPVSIGSDDGLCSIYVQDAPPVAFRYCLDRDRVVCEDVARERSVEVSPGDRRVMGRVTVTVCGS